MRVIVIGSPAARARLHGDLAAAGIDVVAEAGTLDAARARDAGVDAFVLAPESGALDTPAFDGDEWIDAETLTPRERDVLRLLSEGLPNKAIAERLAISDQTVKFHVASIY